MQAVASALIAMLNPVGVDDDVGLIRLQNCGVVASGGDRQDHVAGRHRRHVVHQSAQLVAGFDQYQATRPAELSRGVGHGVGELVVRQLLAVRQHRHVLAVGAKVVEEPGHVSTTPLPNTSIRTLASIGGGFRLCWRTMIGAVSPAGSMVNSTS